MFNQPFGIRISGAEVLKRNRWFRSKSHWVFDTAGRRRLIYNHPRLAKPEPLWLIMMERLPKAVRGTSQLRLYFILKSGEFTQA
jgi:hypothetical protein